MSDADLLAGFGVSIRGGKLGAGLTAIRGSAERTLRSVTDSNVKQIYAPFLEAAEKLPLDATSGEALKEYAAAWYGVDLIPGESDEQLRERCRAKAAAQGFSPRGM